MKRSLWLVLALIGVGLLPVRGEEVSAKPDDWNAVQKAAMSSLPPQPGREAGPAARLKWGFGTFLPALTGAETEYFQSHPQASDRWEAVRFTDMVFRNWVAFLETYDPKTIAEIDAIMSPAARTEWIRKLEQRIAESRTATDVPRDTQCYLEMGPMLRGMSALSRSGATADSPDWTGPRQEMLRFAARFTDTEAVGDAVQTYLARRYGDSKLTPAYRADLADLAANTHPTVAKIAKTKLNRLELLAKPLELAFTAVDGRAVDVKSLRGKVVLVDFWATWCGPCKEELPNVVANYKKYHDRGFEVVGISLENGQLKPSDTPEQTTAKLEKAKKVLTDFTAGHDMPWPQYFDGKHWKNDISTRYAIEGIPAMFLLDQDGNVVSTNARGPKLEEEVKRLLKL